MTSLFTHSAGSVFMEGRYLSPRAASALITLYLDEGAKAAGRKDNRAYRDAVERYWSLNDAMVLAALDDPDRWRDALGFLPSIDAGCAA